MALATLNISSDRKDILVFNRKKTPKPNIVYDTYWRFAAERQEIFFKRVKEQNPPWTEDKILSLFKFTNAYRVTDRVSQYLIKNVIYSEVKNPDDVFFSHFTF